jgi:hypothetical protein
MTFPRGLLRALVFVLAWPALGLLAAACVREAPLYDEAMLTYHEALRMCVHDLEVLRARAIELRILDCEVDYCGPSFDDVESGASTTAPPCIGESYWEEGNLIVYCPDGCGFCTDYEWSDASDTEPLDYRCERWAEGGVCLHWQRVERDPWGSADSEL